MDGLHEEFVVVFGAYWSDNGQVYHLQEDRWAPLQCEDYDTALAVGFSKLHTQHTDPVRNGVTVYFKIEKRYTL